MPKLLRDLAVGLAANGLWQWGGAAVGAAIAAAVGSVAGAVAVLAGRPPLEVLGDFFLVLAAAFF